MLISGTGVQSPFGFSPTGSAALNKADEKTGAVTQEFMKWAKMSPAERMRANVLSSMGLSEEEVAAMPPEKRQAIEAEIKKKIEEQLARKGDAPGRMIDMRV